MRNLSVSKIEAYLLCPKAFKLSYVDRVPQISSGTLLAGRVVHEIVEVALKEFGNRGKYPDWKSLDDLFPATWESQKRKEESKDSFIGWQWEIPEEQAKIQYRPLIRVAREEALEKYRPMILERGPAVEYRIDLEFATSVGPCPIVGYVDLLGADGVLADWKTSTQPEVSARQRKAWLQFACYSFWSWPIVGDEVQKCEKIFLVPGERPRVQYEPFTVGPLHREFFAKQVEEVWKAIHYGVYPAVPGTWKCCEKFCSFHGPCQGSVEKKLPEEIELERAMSDDPW